MIFKDETVIDRMVLKNYSFNPDDRCGAVSLAVLFKYYYDNINKAFLPGKAFNTSNGRELIDYINDGYVTGPSSFDAIRDGANRYLKDNNVPYKAHCLSDKHKWIYYLVIRFYLRHNRPLIINLNSHPEYGNHWVVASGYIKKGKNCNLIISDGRGNASASVSFSYVNGCLFLTCKKRWQML